MEYNWIPTSTASYSLAYRGPFSTGALMPLVYLQIFSVKISPLRMSEVVVGEQVT